MAVGAIGPYDKRLRKTRCLNCASRRVKCSNETPCTSCRRASLACLYPSVNKAVITIGNERSLPKANLSPSVLSNPDGETRSFQHFFHIFLPQNRFSGGAAEWHRYLTTRVPQCRGHFSALAGIGALTAYTHSSDGRHDPRMLELAIQSYQKSVEFLGDRIQMGRESWNHLSMLSLAFLLSLFELMYDPTGVAWNAHMGFGTSVLLNAFGPLSFCCGRSLSIYREIRLFEISRSALFSEPTLLSDEGWLLHDEACRTLVCDWGLLETAFDLFLQCSMLSRGANAYVEAHHIERADTEASTTNELIQTGQNLHSQLETFASLLRANTQAHDHSVAWMYYHALSIYLSGIFDHTLSELCTTLSLRAGEITLHLEGILTRSDEALQRSQVSQVFLLLPLRIAGNRCSTPKQCREVLKRLDALQRQFAVAAAFRSELLDLWSSRSLQVATLWHAGPALNH